MPRSVPVKCVGLGLPYPYTTIMGVATFCGSRVAADPRLSRGEVGSDPDTVYILALFTPKKL